MRRPAHRANRRNAGAISAGMERLKWHARIKPASVLLGLVASCSSPSAQNPAPPAETSALDAAALSTINEESTPTWTALDAGPAEEPGSPATVSSTAPEDGSLSASPESSTPSTEFGPKPECARNGVCDDGVFCNGEERCLDGQCVAGAPVDCNDGVACTADACDETKWQCVHLAPDGDSDGHADETCLDALGLPLGDDCDDADAARHPGATEVCDANEVDEDCDSSTVGERDGDGDGFTSATCCNATSHERQCGPDCNDGNAQVKPNAVEVCDGVDNDCNGRTDDGVELELFLDADGDLYGTGPVLFRGCTRLPGYATIEGDCNDDDSSVRPNAVESCEEPAVDRNCDGSANNPAGGCACASGTERPCLLPGACAAGVVLCVNEQWGSECSVPPQGELCNGLDDDCDGQVDEELASVCYPDADGDGYAATGAAATSYCPPDETTPCPEGYTARAPVVGAMDCDADNAAVSPSALEQCNGADDNCNGLIDDGLPLTQRFVDLDGDGYAGTAVERCSTDPNSAAASTDCLDTNPLVNPGQGGVFSSAACPSGFSPCLTEDTLWRCALVGSTGCTDDLPLAVWDYNCDGETSGAPFVTEPCSVATTCGNGCGPSGFLPNIESASCGSTQDYQVCRCLGAQGGGCAGSVEQRRYTCE